MSFDDFRGGRGFSSAQPIRSLDSSPDAYAREARQVAPLQREGFGGSWASGFADRLARRVRTIRPRQAAFVCAALAILFTLPALWVGFVQDDYVLLSTFKGSPGLESLAQPIWNGFTFSEGDTALNQTRMEVGILPWWASSDWKVNFARPLASLSHWIDYSVFGERPVPMHAINLLLYGLLAASTVLLYARLGAPASLVALAGIIFAVDASHGVAVGWIANRNALLCGLFSVAALFAHHAWRKNALADRPWLAWVKFGLPSAALLALALLSGESAVGLGAYYFAYSVTLDPIVSQRVCFNWKQRFGAYARSITVLLPYLAVVVIWRAMYSALGYGASGSWLYMDPGMSPVLFAKYLATHTPVLLGMLLGAPDFLIWYALGPVGHFVYAAVAAAIIAGIVYLLWPTLKRDRVVRFWTIGCAVSVLPVAGATLPGERNLMLPTLGASIFIAALLLALFARLREKRTVASVKQKRAALKTVAWAFAAIHLAIAPALLLMNSQSVTALDSIFRNIDGTIPTVGGRTVIALSTPLDLLGASLPMIRSGMEVPSPDRWWWLYAGASAMEVSRVDERTLRVAPEGGFLSRPLSQLFRVPQTDPFKTGDQITLSRMSVTVVEVSDDGRPLEAEFAFDSPLEDASFQWLAWKGEGYGEFELPAIGETLTVQGVTLGDMRRLASGRTNVAAAIR